MSTEHAENAPCRPAKACCQRLACDPPVFLAEDTWRQVLLGNKGVTGRTCKAMAFAGQPFDGSAVPGDGQSIRVDRRWFRVPWKRAGINRPQRVLGRAALWGVILSHDSTPKPRPRRGLLFALISAQGAESDQQWGPIPAQERLMARGDAYQADSQPAKVLVSPMIGDPGGRRQYRPRPSRRAGPSGRIIIRPPGRGDLGLSLGPGAEKHSTERGAADP